MDSTTFYYETIFEETSSEKLVLFYESNPDPEIITIAKRVLKAKVDSQRNKIKEIFSNKSLSATKTFNLEVIDKAIQFIEPY